MEKEEDIYRETILELYKNPENFGKLRKYTNSNRSYNATCGDDITIYVLARDGKIEDIRFEGKGCALCIASSSMLTEEVKGKSIEDIMKMKRENITNMMGMDVGPVRVKCVMLPLESLHKSLMTDNNSNNGDNNVRD